MSNIDSTLSERGTRYGSFDDHAVIAQGIKNVMHNSGKWAQLEDDQKEALEMIAHKIGRILNGDPNYIDSWHDIIGYTRLVEQRLEAEQKSVREMIAGTSAPQARRSVVETMERLAEKQNFVGQRVTFIDEDPFA